MNAIIYSRVSTKNQTNQAQINQLKILKNYKVGRVFKEAVSGYTKHSSERPELQKAIRFLKDQSNNADTLMITEISRLGRKTEDVISLMADLKEHGIKVYVDSLKFEFNGSDSIASSMEKFVFLVMADLARFESENRAYRIKQGLEERRLKGLHVGRQYGSIESKEKFLQKHKKVVEFLDKGESVRWIAARLKMSPTTVQKVRVIYYDN